MIMKAEKDLIGSGEKARAGQPSAPATAARVGWGMPAADTSLSWMGMLSEN